MKENLEMKFNQIVEESIATIASLKGLEAEFERAAALLIDTFKRGGKVLICGNGGSAADAMHFVSELLCRFEKKRRHLPAICLSSSSSDLTAFSNDYCYNEVFARQLDAYAKHEDLLIAITTSGKSENIKAAIEKAIELDVKSLSLLGRDGGDCLGLSTVELCVRSESTARIQEAHQVLVHGLCLKVDLAFEDS